MVFKAINARKCCQYMEKTKTSENPEIINIERFFHFAEGNGIGARRGSLLENCPFKHA